MPVVILLIIILLAAIFAWQGSGRDGDITKSTVRREPLPKGSVVETSYYTDELGWIGNPTKLTAGMKNFYRRTGVQPHVFITDNINGYHYPDADVVEEFAFALYDDLFRDEAHLLLILLEYQGEFSAWYVTGAQAKAVLDQEAMDILLDYIFLYYNYTNLSNEEFLSTAFDKAGKRIMSVTVSPWVYVFIVLGVLLILLLLFLWWRKAKQQKNLEAEQTEKMLNIPLETSGDSELEELADKYKDDEDE